MKLSACLLLAAAVAAASADQGFYQPTAGQSAPQYISSSYSSYEYDQPPQKEGWMDRLLGSTRRQDLTGLLGGLFGGLGGLGGIGAGPILGAFVAAIFVTAIVATVAYAGAVFSSSGRGLDSDEWEVKHSLWMDQLHKDFEQSWSEQ